ncbi:hypothetical protein DUNSADRAFT_16382 [Dunaliella salina]|uniref:Uncharacterized protein n=1 Tax=Dunaliella salina TaxID=3046 RepID=A0ABQ7G3P4_DUNSA|nr:hypothetical protein DUNSADRAFT_16382 [Dunaliella salina]|eukprot:KAF5829224.1 hypothetical protein DUNSADRAFT_16382 [Dunaliella salina]
MPPAVPVPVPVPVPTCAVPPTVLEVTVPVPACAVPPAVPAPMPVPACAVPPEVPVPVPPEVPEAATHPALLLFAAKAPEHVNIQALAHPVNRAEFAWAKLQVLRNAGSGEWNGRSSSSHGCSYGCLSCGSSDGFLVCCGKAGIALHSSVQVPLATAVAAVEVAWPREMTYMCCC